MAMANSTRCCRWVCSSTSAIPPVHFGSSTAVLRPNGRLYIYKLPNRYSYLEWVAKKLGLYYHGALPDDRIYDKRSAVELVESNGFRVTAFRRTNLLPLTLPQPWLRPLAPAIWAVNRALRFVPGLSLLATNLELDAVRQ